MPVISVSVIKPKGMPDSVMLEQAIKLAYVGAATDSVKDINALTASWDEDVKTSVHYPAEGGAEVRVHSKIFGIVDAGSPPHKITATAKKFLRFRDGFKPKTSVGSLTSGSGSSGEGTVWARYVRHPGFKGRKFIERIEEKRAKGLMTRVNAAMRKFGEFK